MSDSPERKDTPAGSAPEREVLSSLPRRRPQRLTARRKATRSEQAKTPAKAAVAKPAKAAKAAKAARKQPAGPASAPELPAVRAPKQGFASEEEPSESGFAPSRLIYPALRVFAGASANGLLAGAKLLGGAVSRLGRR